MRCVGCGRLRLDWIALGREAYCPDCVKMLAEQAREDREFEYAEWLEGHLWEERV